MQPFRSKLIERAVNGARPTEQQPTLAKIIKYQCRQRHAEPGNADRQRPEMTHIGIERLAPGHGQKSSPEYPCSTADEAIAGARRVAKVAQCQPEDLKSAVPGLDNQTSHDPSPAWLKPNSHRGPLIDPSLWQSGLR